MREQNKNKMMSMRRDRKGAGLAKLLKAPAVAALFVAWAVGALLGLVLGKLQRLCLGLADVAADAIDVVRDA